MNAALGFHAPNLFPEKEGSDYLTTPYLKILENFRSDFTLFSDYPMPTNREVAVMLRK